VAVHDWTRVDAGIFHDFHNSWTTHLKEALNEGLLPTGYYALAEQKMVELVRPAKRYAQRRVAVRHVSNHRVVALIEIISPANKDRASSVRTFVDKVHASLDVNVNLFIVDLFPPGKHDRLGMHGAIWKTLGRDRETPPADNPVCLMSYVAKMPPEVCLEWIAVGPKTALPAMPLFLDQEHYVNVPLGVTYQAAYRGVPEYWRKVIEGQKRG